MSIYVSWTSFYKASAKAPRRRRIPIPIPRIVGVPTPAAGNAGEVGDAVGVGVLELFGVPVGVVVVDGVGENPPIGGSVGVAVGVGLAVGDAVGVADGLTVGDAVGVALPVGEGDCAVSVKVKLHCAPGVG